MGKFVDSVKGSDGTVYRRMLMSNQSVEELNVAGVSVGLPFTVFKKNTLPHFIISHDQMDALIAGGATEIPYASPEWMRVHKAAVEIGRNLPKL